MSPKTPPIPPAGEPPDMLTLALRTLAAHARPMLTRQLVHALGRFGAVISETELDAQLATEPSVLRDELGRWRTT